MLLRQSLFLHCMYHGHPNTRGHRSECISPRHKSTYFTILLRSALKCIVNSDARPIAMPPPDRFAVHVYRTKDGALRKVVLKPDGKLTSLCWSRGVAKVKSGSIPLIALKVGGESIADFLESILSVWYFGQTSKYPANTRNSRTSYKINWQFTPLPPGTQKCS